MSTGLLVRVLALPKKPGEWTPVTVEGQAQPTNVLLVCPRCTRKLHIEGAFHNLLTVIKHAVVFEDDGTVTITPTVDCPYHSCHWSADIARSEYTERT